jgi:hypothetical protein
MCCGRKRTKRRNTNGIKSGLYKKKTVLKPEQQEKKNEQHPPNQQ